MWSIVTRKVSNLLKNITIRFSILELVNISRKINKKLLISQSQRIAKTRFCHICIPKTHTYILHTLKDKTRADNLSNKPTMSQI